MRQKGNETQCPCGSGEKASLCCGDSKVIFLHQARWRKLGYLLRKKLGEFADRQAFAREAARAQELYLGFIDAEHFDIEDQFIMERCFEWYIFDHTFAGGTILKKFAGTTGLTDQEIQLLVDWDAARISFYEVIEVKESKSLVIKCLIGGQIYEVCDAAASQGMEKEAIILMRLLKVGDQYEFSTSGLALPHFCKEPLLKSLRRHYKKYCTSRSLDPQKSWPLFLRERSHLINGWVMEAGYAAENSRWPGELEVSDQLWEMVEEEQGPEESPRHNISSRIAQRITESFWDQYYKEWVAKPMLALGDKSPLEACRTPEGRGKVQELLAELEKVEDERVSNGETHYDIDNVRLMLGIQEPNAGSRGKGVLLPFKRALPDADQYSWRQPRHAQVAQSVVRELSSLGFTSGQQQGALALWHDYCEVENPGLRKESLWVASVIYAISRVEFDEDINQQQLANRYGVSASAISLNFRSLCKALGLSIFDQRYSTRSLPLEGLEESDPLWAQIMENLKL